MNETSEQSITKPTSPWRNRVFASPLRLIWSVNVFLTFILGPQFGLFCFFLFNGSKWSAAALTLLIAMLVQFAGLVALGVIAVAIRALVKDRSQIQAEADKAGACRKCSFLRRLGVVVSLIVMLVLVLGPQIAMCCCSFDCAGRSYRWARDDWSLRYDKNRLREKRAELRECDYNSRKAAEIKDEIADLERSINSAPEREAEEMRKGDRYRSYGIISMLALILQLLMLGGLGVALPIIRALRWK